MVVIGFVILLIETEILVEATTAEVSEIMIVVVFIIEHEPATELEQVVVLNVRGNVEGKII